MTVGVADEKSRAESGGAGRNPNEARREKGNLRRRQRLLRGLRVPEDLAVIGFGDLEFAADIDPPLTTVRIDGAAIGRQAAAFLLQRAQGRQPEKRIVDVGFKLVARASA